MLSARCARFPLRWRAARTAVLVVGVIMVTTLTACRSAESASDLNVLPPAPDEVTEPSSSTVSTSVPGIASPSPSAGGNAGASTTAGQGRPARPAADAAAAGRPTNCVRVPHLCGYPDETNTGWRHTGVKLTTEGVNLTSEGEFHIDTPGAVIDGKDIRGCVNIKANNVTIKRSRVRCASYFPIRVYEGFRKALIEDVEIDGANSPSGNAAVGFDYYTLRRVDIHSVTDGPHLGGDVLIEDSYVHDLYGCGICHNDAIQSNGAFNAVLRHNTFVNNASGRNAVVRIATEVSTVKGFTVQNNLLAGGNYAVQVRSQGNGFPQGVRVIDNRIVGNWRYGPFDVVDGTIEASGNYLDDSLAALSP